MQRRADKYSSARFPGRTADPEPQEDNQLQSEIPDKPLDHHLSDIGRRFAQLERLRYRKSRWGKLVKRIGALLGR